MLIFCMKVTIMIEFQCTIQEGCIPQTMRSVLAETIETVCNEVLGPDQGPVSIIWIEVPKGFGFRGGEPSTTSLVRGLIPDGCSSVTRAKLLREIGHYWYDVSGTTEEELVVSARDRSWNG